MLELIIRETLSSIKRKALISVESSGEIITINNSKNSLVDIEVGRTIQICPGIVSRLVIWEWKLMTFQKDTLWYSSILNSWFNNVNGIVIQVVENNAFTNSEIFIWVFDNWFLEVSVEFKNLSIILQPLWSNLWNSIILLILSLWHTSKLSSSAVSHWAQQCRVNILLDVVRFFCDGSVLDSKELSLVIPCNCWVSICVSWKERQLGWQIIWRHFSMILYSLIWMISKSPNLLCCDSILAIN